MSGHYNLSDSMHNIKGGSSFTEKYDEWARNVVQKHYKVVFALLIILVLYILYVIFFYSKKSTTSAAFTTGREGFSPTTLMNAQVYERMGGEGFGSYTSDTGHLSLRPLSEPMGGASTDPTARSPAGHVSATNAAILSSKTLDCANRHFPTTHAWDWMEQSLRAKGERMGNRPLNDNDFTKILAGM